MPTSNDLPYNLNPAYQKVSKPYTGSDYVIVPIEEGGIYDDQGNELTNERIEFDYEQYGKDMIVWLPAFKAEREDVTNMIQDLYKNFSIEYK